MGVGGVSFETEHFAFGFGKMSMTQLSVPPCFYFIRLYIITSL